MNKSAKKLFKIAGFEEHTEFFSFSGIEQEFFLIDKDQYFKRPDLVLTGRTLQGATPSRGQELCDSYFGPISENAWKAINEIEKNLWRLGVPITTRHREVAPNQYELAPIYETSTLATDHNMITMEVMYRVAAKYNLSVLFHEKPFKGVNGSGKHNNWSLGSNKCGSLFNPGKDIKNNIPFLLCLAATIRGVDLHQDLLRFSISGASNDHRLGAHEAPPAILSIYLGDDLEKVVNSILGNDKKPLIIEGKEYDFNVPFLPKFKGSPTDRNRTSPFAFTGNRFEFRAVGSSQSPSMSNTVLNSMIAESFQYFYDVIENNLKNGSKREDVIWDLIRDTINKHYRILFSGDGYSEEWQIEAKKRGLLNMRTTPDILI